MATDDPDPTKPRVLVLGASGYVGGRLVPELVRTDHRVRCLTRSANSLRGVPWVDDVEVREGDLLDASSLGSAFDDVDTVVYLVHSLDEDGDFEDTERRAATNTRSAAAAAGVRRVVYLSGLGEAADLSPHLASRHAVGEELAAGSVEVIELRAAVVLGAGSASFEMLRSLTEVLPVMFAPRWLDRTMVQPIAIADVLTYLLAAVDAPPREGERSHHAVVQVGGPDAMTYRGLIDAYCEVAGLPRRRILSTPLVPIFVSARWVSLVTPLPASLSRRLVESLEHDVIVTDDSAAAVSAHQPVPAHRAIEMALAAVDDLDIPTHWSGRTERARAAEPRPWDPDWSGGTVYEDHRQITTSASPEQVMRTTKGVGGDRGWYGFGFLWRVRGLADQLVGGVGLRRGRRHPDDIDVGEALDFWRVDVADPDLFRLRAEMRLPGTAWLEWSVAEDDSGDTLVTQRARYVPTGLWGRAYWWIVWPFHLFVFPTMLRRLVAAAA